MPTALRQQNFAQVAHAVQYVGISNIVEGNVTTVRLNQGYIALIATTELLCNFQNVRSESMTDRLGNQKDRQRPASASTAEDSASGHTAGNFQVTSSCSYSPRFNPRLSGSVFNPIFGNQFDVFDMSNPSWKNIIDADGCI